MTAALPWISYIIMSGWLQKKWFGGSQGRPWKRHYISIFYIYHHGNYKNAYLSAPITMRTVKTLKNCVWFIGRRMAWNEMGSVYQQSKHVLWMIFGSNTLEDVEGFCATNIIFWMRILSDEENGRGGGGGKGREGVVTESGSSHWYFDGAGQLVANSQS